MKTHLICTFLLMVSGTSVFAAPTVSDVSGAAKQQFEKSCAGQLLSLTASAYGIKTIKTPVMNKKDDQASLTLFDSLKKLMSKMQATASSGKPDQAIAEKISKIFTSALEIFSRETPKEMDLCVETNIKIMKPCLTIDQSAPDATEKINVCVAKVKQDPEAERAIKEMSSMFYKRFLVTK